MTSVVKQSLLGLSLLAASQAAHATIVLVETNMGNFEINLLDQSTPATVQNFLSYVKDGSYDSSVIHRAEKGFMVQGGGYKTSGNNDASLLTVTAKATVKNEPKWSNVRGTIAMAKREYLPDSASSQWFINLVDNNDPGNKLNLDRQNSGFTVFGIVTGSGMSVIDPVASLYQPGTGTLPKFPLRNYSAADAAANVPITPANMVVIEKITVINDAPDTAASLTLKANTQYHLDAEESGSSGSTGSSGSLSWLWLISGAALLAGRRLFQRR
ncbi:peptidylprolyl isomerase [Rheinheimera sp.]|uniref:peptidylprolyl isomerase n=1 Tax=Rheinheimera sp. TaxID=1869214 RepID=UPI00307EE8B7